MTTTPASRRAPLPTNPVPFGNSLHRNPLLSQWVSFATTGRVEVRVGKVELGQGILTALSQIAAEELEVDWSRVQVLPASTPDSPDEGFTAGSRSIMDSGSAVREVCAEMRRLLLAAASSSSGTAADELHVRDGEVVDADGKGHGSYWDLLRPEDLDVPVSGTAHAKDPARHRLVGQSVPRRDLERKLTGAPAYVHDLRLPGQVFGRVVRPPSPAACLLDVDDSAARALPSVLTVVRRGSFLGVVADREEEAIRAAELLRAGSRWQEEDTLPTDDGWLERLVGQPADTLEVARKADPTAADRVVAVHRASYGRTYVAHGSLGPGAAVAWWTDDDVSVWTHSQGIYPLRRALAVALDLDPERLTLHHMEGAGCYGHNSADDVAFDAALLARAVPGRPVQVVWSREDEFAWEPYGSAMVADVAVGVDAAGDLVTWEQHCWGTGHDSRPGFSGQPGLLGAWHAANIPPPAPADPPLSVGGGTGRNAVPNYTVADLDVQAHRLLTAPLRSSSMRGLGATVNVLAIESAMDELAGRIGADPLEYRLRHLSDERARAVLLAAAEQSGWRDRRREESVGWGLAVARYKDVCGYCAVVARIEAVSEVRVTDLWVTVDAGQIINPDGLTNQVEGGSIQAASWTLGEEITFDARTVTSRDWESYPILRFSQVPRVHVTLLPRPDEPPLGVGEVTGGPVAAALANALFDAIGVRVRRLPLTPDRIASVIDAE